MENNFAQRDYANILLGKMLKKNNKVGLKMSAFSLACECIEEIDKREEITFNERTLILGIAYGLVEELIKKGYMIEQSDGRHNKIVKKIENIEVSDVVQDCGNYKVELKEKADEMEE